MLHLRNVSFSEGTAQWTAHDADVNAGRGFSSRLLVCRIASVRLPKATCPPMEEHGEEQSGNPGMPDPDFDPALFLVWRSPRFGGANPEPMANPVWDWLIRTGLNAYQANERLGGPDSFDAGPCWSFDRFGRSSTLLADGRLVLIGGEHEDSYDSDFCIYNDVVVRHPDGRLEVFGYPKEVFPPTDFHSATLVGERVMLIGSLGYAESRRPGATQVLELDIATMAIRKVATHGVSPGWIHGHSAELAADGCSITVRSGRLDQGESHRSLVENIDDWRLHLFDGRWERLTERRWSRWEVRRTDNQRNHLWNYQTALWDRDFGLSRKVSGFMNSAAPSLDPDVVREIAESSGVNALEREIGRAPDMELFARRFRPSIPHLVLPEREGEHEVYRNEVAGVVVRYVNDGRSVQMTVEGELPAPVVEQLARELQAAMAGLENADCGLWEL